MIRIARAALAALLPVALSVTLAAPAQAVDASVWRLSAPRVPGAAPLTCGSMPGRYMRVDGTFLAGAAKAEPYKVALRVNKFGYIRKVRVWRYYGGAQRGYVEKTYSGKLTSLTLDVSPYFTTTPWRGDQYDRNREFIQVTTSSGESCGDWFGWTIIETA